MLPISRLHPPDDATDTAQIPESDSRSMQITTINMVVWAFWHKMGCVGKFLYYVGRVFLPITALFLLVEYFCNRPLFWRTCNFLFPYRVFCPDPPAGLSDEGRFQKIATRMYYYVVNGVLLYTIHAGFYADGACVLEIDALSDEEPAPIDLILVCQVPEFQRKKLHYTIHSKNMSAIALKGKEGGEKGGGNIASLTVCRNTLGPVTDGRSDSPMEVDADWLCRLFKAGYTTMDGTYFFKCQFSLSAITFTPDALETAIKEFFKDPPQKGICKYHVEISISSGVLPVEDARAYIDACHDGFDDAVNGREDAPEWHCRFKVWTCGHEEVFTFFPTKSHA